MIFDEAYSRLYDSFNLTKDYESEFQFLVDTLSNLVGRKYQFTNGLEIGCGSGSFTKFLDRIGEKLLATDISTTMIDQARKLPLKSTQFQCSTVSRQIEGPADLDLVASLFHVFSYFTTNEVTDFVNLSTKRLKAKGLLVFDYWDILGLVAAPPTERNRKTEIDGKVFLRRSIPVVKEDQSLVEVCFKFFELSKDETFEKELFSEIHTMHVYNLETIIDLLPGFDFLGSYDLVKQSQYQGINYGNLLVFRKI